MMTTNDPHITPPKEKLVTRTVFGRKARFHRGCDESFREDRKHGLIYSSYLIDGKLMGVEEASLACEFCTYCGE